MKDRKIVKLANNLSNEDLCMLFNMTSDRFRIHVGKLGDIIIGTEARWASLNGVMIQINTELSELSDMSDDYVVDRALRSLKKDA